MVTNPRRENARHECYSSWSMLETALGGRKAAARGGLFNCREGDNMATQIPFGKNRYLRIYKKDWLIILAVASVIVIGLTLFIVNQSKQNDSRKTATKAEGYSLTNGYFYQGLGDSRYSVKFNYPKEWGDVAFSKNLLENVQAESSSVTGRFVYGTFTNNPNIYFVSRSPDYNISPEIVKSNSIIAQTAGVPPNNLETIYGQIGASGCIGDGKYVEDAIEQNNAKILFCPKGGEANPTLDTIIFETKDVSRVGYGRLLPAVEDRDGKTQHIVVIDLPRSDFGNSSTNLFAVAFVDTNSSRVPDTEFLKLVSDVKIL